MTIAGSSHVVDTLDPWGQPSEPYVPLTRVPARSQPIPDDWDDGDDEDEDEDSQKIWENANTKSPMPELVISPSSTSPAVVSPPTTAIQSPLRILKRPPAGSNSSISGSPNSSSSSSTNNNTSSTSFAEREAKYHAARERIFGEGQSTLVPAERTPLDLIAKTPPPAASIVRNPRGPSTAQEPPDQNPSQNATTTPRGFTGRGGIRAPTSGDGSQRASF